MATDSNRLRVDQDGLFTHVEHTVLASWFGQQPPIDSARIKLDDALAQLGFGEDCRPYSQAAAAVAHVLLEAIEDRLPVWACRKGDKLIQSRRYREPHQKPRRQAALLPSELFAINWASSGPGFDWPITYNVVWTPTHDRYVDRRMHFAGAKTYLGATIDTEISAASGNFIDAFFNHMIALTNYLALNSRDAPEFLGEMPSFFDNFHMPLMPPEVDERFLLKSLGMN
jgi:hypothetical protein